MPPMPTTPGTKLARLNQSVHDTGRPPGPGSRPGNRLSARRYVSPDVTTYRASSAWTIDLLQQHSSIHQSSVNPATAPRLVVSTSSPDPTMLPAITMLGPTCRQRSVHVT